MKRFSYDSIKDKPTTAAIHESSTTTVLRVINAPNHIPSLQFNLEINKTRGFLAIGDIINVVVTRLNVLGLNSNFPIENITLLIDGTPYDNKSKNIPVPHNGKLSELCIKLPKEIDKKYLLAHKEADESTTLNGQTKPSPWWWPFN